MARKKRKIAQNDDPMPVDDQQDNNILARLLKCDGIEDRERYAKELKETLEKNEAGTKEELVKDVKEELESLGFMLQGESSLNTMIYIVEIMTFLWTNTEYDLDYFAEDHLWAILQQCEPNYALQLLIKTMKLIEVQWKRCQPGRVRDTYLLKGILQRLGHLSEFGSRELERACYSLIITLCRGPPLLPTQFQQDIAPLLKRKLLTSDDDELLAEVCWALSYVTDGTNDRINTLLEEKIVVRLLELLQRATVTYPALRTVGNIASGYDDQTQIVVDLGIVPALKQLLYATDKETRKEVLFTLSNILAGSSGHIEAVIKEGLIPLLIREAHKPDLDPVLRKELNFVLCNMTEKGTVSQVDYVVSCGCLEVWCRMVSDYLNDETLRKPAIGAIEAMLSTFRQERSTELTNRYLRVALHTGLLDALEEIMQSEWEDTLHTLCNRLLDEALTDEALGNAELEFRTTL